MLLNALQIKQKQLLSRTKNNSFKGASYDLTVGEIITMDGKTHDGYKIPPRGMVLIVTEEIFHLPSNIIGFTTVKNSLSRDGIMAINIGIVDPEWNQPISSSIINFGNTNHFIKKGDPFLRMTFHEFGSYDIKVLNSVENYENNSDESIFQNYVSERRQQSVKVLSETFLSINQIKDEISKKVTVKFLKNVFLLAASVAIVGFILTYSKDFYEFRNTKSNEKIIILTDSLKNRIGILENIIKLNKTDTNINKN